MVVQRQLSSFVSMYLQDVTSRVVARSGRPEDRFHLGKIILETLRTAPDMDLQIDAATGESESFQSVLSRSVRFARYLRAASYAPGDVIALMAPNHLDLTVAIYAAMFNGLTVAALENMSGVGELKNTFSATEPKLVVCQHDKEKDVKEALQKANVKANIITFGGGENNFIDLFQNVEANLDDFTVTDVDTAENICFLVPTSGTTGVPKSAAVSHKNTVIHLPLWLGMYDSFPSPTKMIFHLSPLQWVTGIMNYLLSAIFHVTRVQTSGPGTVEHYRSIINKYKPSFMICSPTMMTSMVKHGGGDSCDFSCLEVIALGGSAVTKDIGQELKRHAPNAHLFPIYGLTEIGMALCGVYDINKPVSFKDCGILKFRLVDPDTGKDVCEPFKKGELWATGPSVFKGYYNRPDATKETFSEDGWLKTGDIFHRDDDFNYFFLDRMKMLLKYRNYQISPVEVEAVIRQHAGVSDAGVAGVPDSECGELPVACVVRRPGASVTAQEIKDLVKSSLQDSKQLRGGVIFVESLPMTASTKVNRKKLKEMVCTLPRE
ncbi:hypothetical protein JYU34_011941 [Plutella xylostella]|uniref:Luciferin 4-monooxygenase-like n=1 Tax=Plutella xylostella TaxID=51655 RepID=A0ABQ7QDW5_PLUXY|nr:hypothetical protein JYU34_011941 [Plutella xylostella]